MEDVPISDSECELVSESDVDYEDDEADEMVKDKVPPTNPNIVYDRNDPPMTVGSIYKNICLVLS